MKDNIKVKVYYVDFLQAGSGKRRLYFGTKMRAEMKLKELKRSVSVLSVGPIKNMYKLRRELYPL